MFLLPACSKAVFIVMQLETHMRGLSPVYGIFNIAPRPGHSKILWAPSTCFCNAGGAQVWSVTRVLTQDWRQDPLNSAGFFSGYDDFR